MFQLNRKGGVLYYTVTAFRDTGVVRHGFSTRRGGVSKGIYSEMNFRFHCDDKEENVRENFKIMASVLGMDYRRMVLSRQVHETNIIQVHEDHLGNGILYENRFDSADGLVTNLREVPLAVFYADCVPVLFLDPQTKVIGAVHSGWRGTADRISGKMVQIMKDQYGCDPKHILCAIGPSIGKCCYEVSDDVAQRFRDAFGAAVLEKHEKKYHVDLQSSVALTLEEQGISEEHITQAHMCTQCNGKLLFSHRQTAGQRGVMGAFIELI